MRLVDADTLKRKTQKLSTETWKTNRVALVTHILNQFIDWIEGMPTIDAVEVVRCRKCEYWKRNPNTKNYGVCRKVSYDDFEVVMERDDFCSYGIRRENGEV